jgi:aspartate carbamoyltransferase catalytic subunit
MLKGRHLIEPGNLELSEIDEICQLAEKMYKNPAEYAEVCHGKVIATLFFEPSTRTRL